MREAHSSSRGTVRRNLDNGGRVWPSFHLSCRPHFSFSIYVKLSWIFCHFSGKMLPPRLKIFFSLAMVLGALTVHLTISSILFCLWTDFSLIVVICLFFLFFLVSKLYRWPMLRRVQDNIFSTWKYNIQVMIIQNKLS